MANDQQARQQQIIEQASMWLEKLERAITQEDAAHLRRWLRTRAHREAIVERCKRWHGDDIRAVLGELVPVETFAERAERRYDRMVIGIVFAVLAFSTTTVLVAAVRVWSNSANRHNLVRSEIVLDTRAGERKTVRLPDGSVITMNELTRLQAGYIPQRREVFLLKGEATFEVENDSKRPFLVYAGTRQLNVIAGSAKFDVARVTPENAQVTVVSGDVELAEPRVSKALPPALIREHVDSGGHTFGAGEVGSLGPSWFDAARTSAQNIADRLAWQRHLDLKCGTVDGTVGAYYVCSTIH